MDPDSRSYFHQIFFCATESVPKYFSCWGLYSMANLIQPLSTVTTAPRCTWELRHTTTRTRRRGRWGRPPARASATPSPPPRSSTAPCRAGRGRRTSRGPSSGQHHLLLEPNFPSRYVLIKVLIEAIGSTGWMCEMPVDGTNGHEKNTISIR